jgi:chromosome segregation ATPase
MPAEAPPEPASPVKKVVTLVVVGVICLILGGVGQYFAWPLVSKMIGKGSDQPKLDLQALVNTEQRKNAKLASEVKEFTKLGGPNEVTQLKQNIAQLRDSQGPLSEFESKYNLAKEQESAYNELVKKTEELESKIADTRSEIRNVQSEIEQTRLQVNSLARETAQAYERFRVELSRAELSQRMVAELRMQDIEKLQAELDRLERHLSQLQPIDLSASSGEAAGMSGVEGADSGN